MISAICKIMERHYKIFITQISVRNPKWNEWMNYLKSTICEFTQKLNLKRIVSINEIEPIINNFQNKSSKTNSLTLNSLKHVSQKIRYTTSQQAKIREHFSQCSISIRPAMHQYHNQRH